MPGKKDFASVKENGHRFQVQKRLILGDIRVLPIVTGSGKRDKFAHIFKIELLARQGRVSSQL